MSLQRIFITARYQSRLVFRQKTFWVIQLLIFLIIYINAFQGMSTDASSADFVAAIVGKGFGIFLFLAAVFLVVPSVIQNIGRVADLFWVTSLRPFEYVLGLFLGLYLPLAFTVCLSLLLHYVATFLPGATAKTPALALLLTGGLLPMLVITALAVASYLCLAMLFRISVAVYALAGIFWVAWISGFITPVATLLSPWNFGLMTYTLSVSVGFGPDRSLVTGLFLLWLAVCGSILMGLPLIVAWSNRQDEPAPRKIAIALFAVSLLVPIYAYTHFNQVVAQTQVPAPPRDWQTNLWNVLSDDTRISVNADQIAGDSRLVLKYTGKSQVSQLLLRLNSGLVVNHATLNGQPFVLNRNGESLIGQLPAQIDPGKTIEVALSYSGRLIIHREDIAQSYALRGLWIQYPLPVRAYLQAGNGFFERDGDWRPWPFTSQQHLAKNENKLTITGIERNKVVLSSATTSIYQDQGESQFIWTGPQPPALLVFGDLKIVDLGSGNKACFFSSPTQDDLVAAQHSIQILTEALEWAGIEQPSYLTIAQLPFLQDAAWGNGILFYPEPSLVMTYLSGIHRKNSSPEQMTIYRAHLITQAVLRASIHLSDPVLSYIPPAGEHLQPQIPFGRLVPMSQETFSEALAWYFALLNTASQQQELDLMAREISFWKKVLEFNQTGENQTVAQAIARQSLFGKLADLGIPTTSWSPDRLASLASNIIGLDEIYQSLGKSSFQALFQRVCAQYSPNSETVLSGAAFFQEAAMVNH